MSSQGIRVIVAIILYVIAIVYQGYQYGQSDQTQILPVLYAQDHPESYQQDHYVQEYLSSQINERTVFHALFRFLGYDVPWIVFIWHAISSIALILALIRIAATIIKNNVLQWISVALILTIGFHTSAGSNELYYNLFIPSLPAKALAAWAIVHWLNSKYQWWILLLIFSTLLQPLVGAQVFILTSLALIFDNFHKRSSQLFPWKIGIVYLILIVPWFVLLSIHNGGHDDPTIFMDIMQFRLSHHFFGMDFRVFDLVAGIMIALIAVSFFRGKLRWFCIVVVLGCVVYEIGVEILRSPLVLYTQWWKTTIWLEAFAIMIVVSLLEKGLKLSGNFNRYQLIYPIAFLILVSLYRLSGIFGDKPEYMLPFYFPKSDGVQISELANELTPENSVFIIPVELTAFRWYSKRSLYVDYKSMLHNEAFLKDWRNRIDQVYDFQQTHEASGKTTYSSSIKALSASDLSPLQKWKELGITHIITGSDGIPFLEPLGKNRSFSIYRIP